MGWLMYLQSAVQIPAYTFDQALGDLWQIGAIVAVSITLMVAMTVELFLPRGLRGPAVSLLAIAGLLVAAGLAAALWLSGDGRGAYSGFATGDRFATFFEVTFAVLGVMTILVSRGYLSRRGFREAEFSILILASVAGMMVVTSATSLVSIFLGIELLSVTLYIACAYDRQDTASQESGVKYLLVGGFGSAIILYGMALIYGASGSTTLTEIARNLVDRNAQSSLLIMGMVFLAAGFSFKASAAPFHMWTPDVYQGAPLPVTAMMSVGTKAAAIAVIVRVFGTALQPINADSMAVLSAFAVASLVVGNIGALAQTSLKRLLAYSGVAHAGYLLVGVVGIGSGIAWPVLFYLVGYLFMNFGALAVLTVLSRDRDIDRPEDLRGLWRQNPIAALMLAVFLFSLAGFPPSVGFFGKLFVFWAAYQAGYGWLVIVAVLASVVSVAYYVRILVPVFQSDEPASAIARRPAVIGQLVFVLAAAATLALGILPAQLSDLSRLGSQTVTQTSSR